MCTLHVSVDIIFGHSCVNPQMWIAVYISMTNLLFHIVFLKHHEKQMLIKRCKALHPGEIIDQKKVSSRPSARPDMRHRVATVLGNLLRQQLWVIVTSKFGPLAPNPNPNRAYAEFIRSPPRPMPNWCWYYAMRLYAGGCPYFLPHPHPLANGNFMFILTPIQ